MQNVPENPELARLAAERAVARKERNDMLGGLGCGMLALGGGCLGVVAVGAGIAAVCALFVRVFLAVLG